jgi:hypothetical protein
MINLWYFPRKNKKIFDNFSENDNFPENKKLEININTNINE